MEGFEEGSPLMQRPKRQQPLMEKEKERKIGTEILGEDIAAMGTSSSMSRPVTGGRPSLQVPVRRPPPHQQSLHRSTQHRMERWDGNPIHRRSVSRNYGSWR